MSDIVVGYRKGILKNAKNKHVYARMLALSAFEINCPQTLPKDIRVLYI